ncbi:MAG: methyltransferase domain-containing protein [Bacteroidota bacterium]
MRPDRLLPFLVCPESKEKLRLENGILRTNQGKNYPLNRSGKVDFIGKAQTASLEEQRDLTDRVKAAFKKLLGRSYILLVHVIAPVMPRIHWPGLQTYWKYIVKKHAENKSLVIQVGSGNDRITADIVNIDLFDFPETDLIADCTRLPFADSSVDGVVSLAVLEHVPNPDDFLKEAHRVLRPGGFIVTGVPFIQGFHASPSDYTRWTHDGLDKWHRQHGFIKEDIIPNSGPTSAFLWIAQEWMAILLSFGITPLYYTWWAVFTLALFPVKLLDLLLIHYPQSYKINSFNIYVGKKA